ncbi:MAG: peptide deformylase [Clostridiales bacterium]|nr:peptide deformylase [Candidatus Crickella caballi]
MVRSIMRDPLFLSRRSVQATKADIQIGMDLLQTLMSYQDECVGMAANMIGELKNIIAINNDGMFMLMYNPMIVAKSGKYETEEGCLSLAGIRRTTRYERIRVSFQDAGFRTVTAEFTGFTAQIIQHEVDHCNGILI